MVESFETRLERLESKMALLEEQAKNRERRLFELIAEQRVVAEKQVPVVSLSKSVESSDHNSNRQTNAIYRTCHEARSADSSLKSGMHWIDPDGKGIGDDPIGSFHQNSNFSVAKKIKFDSYFSYVFLMLLVVVT